jgi:Got1/Sft2-like family
VFFFSAGNISALSATCFLVGPGKQLRNMFTKERMGAAIAFISAMVLTLVVSIKFRGTVDAVLIVIPCLIVQMLALLWCAPSIFVA